MKFGAIPTDSEMRPPRSHADRFDIMVNASRPGREHRAMVAALGACWPRYRQEHPFTGDVLAYGKSTWDALVDAGYSPEAITHGALAAFHAVRRALAPVDKAVSGFSQPPDTARDGNVSGGGSEFDSY